ncbi:hypothetical protein [Ilumatobacter sp.]|uniref:hypothetical protein n=1 Tax=Ilumatobacter sp. TaxID=1967498 RepID=UPI003B523DAC
MRLTSVLVAAAALGLSSASVAHAGPDDGGGPPLIPGARQVHIRNSSGGLGVYTSIPSGSTFRTHGGGAAAECTGVAAGDDPDTLDIVEDQRPIRSTKWIFIEGVAVVIPIPVDLDVYDPSSGPSLDDTVRTFSVYCADTFFSSNFKGFIDVAATDPMLDPRTQLTDLYNGLELEALAVYENKVVGEWGGLVVRNPAWLAINGSAWRTQTSNAQYYRGWELYLITQPVGLDFTVDFVPDPDRPSPPFSGVVPCISTDDDFPVGETIEFPQRPSDLADFAEPGSNRACEWTPPGPGEVTITARQTFAVTFWASGSVEPQPDYVWTSEPVTFRVGELVAVNVNE